MRKYEATFHVVEKQVRAAVAVSRVEAGPEQWRAVIEGSSDGAFVGVRGALSGTKAQALECLGAALVEAGAAEPVRFRELASPEGNSRVTGSALDVRIPIKPETARALQQSMERLEQIERVRRETYGPMLSRLHESGVFEAAGRFSEMAMVWRGKWFEQAMAQMRALQRSGALDAARRFHRLLPPQAEALAKLSADYARLARTLAGPVVDMQRQLSAVRALERRLGPVTFRTEAMKALASLSGSLAANSLALGRVLEAAPLREAPWLRSLMARPPCEATVFVERALEEAAQAEDPPGRRMGEAAAEGAALQVSASTRLTVALAKDLTGLVPESRALLPSLPTFNFFAVQKTDLQERCRADPPGLSSEGVLAGLPSSVYASVAWLLCQLMHQVNEACLQSARDAVFKPTNRLVGGASAILFLVATNRAEFGEYLSWLYQMVYEGSGAAKRILEYLTDDESRALWTLKHLRTWAHHDVDHAPAKDARNKQALIGECFQELIGRPMPQTRQEFRAAQLGLADSVVEMMRLLLERVGAGRWPGTGR